MTSLFGHSVRSEGLALYMAEAVVCFAVIYLLSASTSGPGSPGGFQAAGLAAILAVSTGLAAAATGMHSPNGWRRARGLLTGTLLTAILLAPLAWAAVEFLRVDLGGRATSPAVAVVLLSAAGTGVVLLTRLLFLGVARTGLFTQRVAVLDGSRTALMKLPPAGPTAAEEPFRVALRISSEALAEAGGAAAVPGLGAAELRSRGIRWVVAPEPATVPATLRENWSQAGIRLVGEVEFLERLSGRVDLDALEPHWLETARGAHMRRSEAFVGRAFDVTVSLALLLLTLPLTALAALAIRIDSPGPVFYRQARVGQGGKIIMLTKLRSMRVDAEAGGAPQWATRRDPRVTRVGRFLRLTRIDEIPQVLNVLKGDMAFIGPRPERPAFVEQLSLAIPHYADRAVVKPGITGWAQVNFPYGASVDDARQKLTYDLYYVRRRSLFLDLLILVATVRVILFQEGSR
ncbi:exopolysaccharide biosynthesis polyprenyl glycosylphosphotransferase [Muricoccus aerilatus]|uniref:exopolysaccharide biosynthesis polyprenyl glycosylphosphotransferase n=1 Tax=Muricoccus aerilatus TaxID=452982 RepID=UPI000A0667E9|nr:exopolysaccharide biosynthesis polyprenyl glycosylphosphotransferase [Roseomonas aerilata]